MAVGLQVALVLNLWEELEFLPLKHILAVHAVENLITNIYSYSCLFMELLFGLDTKITRWLKMGSSVSSPRNNSSSVTRVFASFQPVK